MTPYAIFDAAPAGVYAGDGEMHVTMIGNADSRYALMEPSD
jgi:hypothetical protein